MVIIMITFLINIISKLFFGALHTVNTGSFPAKLSAKEEEKLLKEKQSGSTEARNKLIEHNLRLVAHVSKKYYSKTKDHGDLISIGTIGLIKGIESFNPDKGTKLATYAARCIENEILMYFRSQRKTANEVYMSDPIDFDNEGNPLTLMDLICESESVSENVNRKIETEKLFKYVNLIPDEREKYIILHRYGIFGNSVMTQREIAKELNISRSYVSRIEKKILNQLKIQLDNN